jgi:hypothetical protein
VRREKCKIRNAFEAERFTSSCCVFYPVEGQTEKLYKSMCMYSNFSYIPSLVQSAIHP